MQILNTLYVATPESYLRLENETLRIEVQREERLCVPLHHLGSVVCMGNVGISTPLMHRLAETGISLVLLDGNGRFKGRVEGPVSGNVLLRRAQYERSLDGRFALETGRACVAGKIRNARQVVLRAAREAKTEDAAVPLDRVANDLAAALRSLPGCLTLDIVRGVEGEAARQYFSGLKWVVRPDLREAFGMERRSRRPPRDRVNALLSFLYSMWMNDCRSAVEAVGLDPQVGFLHALRPGRAALALDLMEEFRPIADRLALTMINRNQIGVESFSVRDGGAVELGDDARKAVVIAFQERKQEELTHPLLAEAIPLGLMPLVQARLLARAIRGETDGYLPFVMR